MTLSVDMPEAATGWCDRDQMTQGLWALLHNAAEAALAGTVDPAVTLAVAGQADRLVIRVSDSGQGVPRARAGADFPSLPHHQAGGFGHRPDAGPPDRAGTCGELTLLPVAVTTFEWVVPDVSFPRLQAEVPPQSASEGISHY